MWRGAWLESRAADLSVEKQAVKHGIASTTTSLQHLKTGNLVPIERNDFAIKQQRGRGQGTNGGNDTWKTSGAVFIISTEQRDCRSFFVGKDPDAVIFLLVEPIRIRRKVQRQAWPTWVEPETELCSSLHVRCDRWVARTVYNPQKRIEK